MIMVQGVATPRYPSKIASAAKSATSSLSPLLDGIG
jgi:hypothetical protein